MIKRMIGPVLILALLTVAVVQAMEKDKIDEEIISQPTTKSIPTEDIPGLGIGLKAPDFELTTLDGKTVRLSDYRGKKVMLNFWATWCPPCKAEIPHMQKFYDEVKGDIEILAVNIDTENDVAGFAKKMQIHFPILLDKDEKVMNTYQILTIPTTFFIDKDGLIQNKFMGAMSLEKMYEYTKNL